MTSYIITRAENGGWIIRLQDNQNGLIPVIIGAYTNAADALAGFARLMNDEGKL